VRLIQISVTSVWLLRAVEMDFARGKIRNRWLMMGILLGVMLWIPGMKEAGFPEYWEDCYCRYLSVGSRFECGAWEPVILNYYV